MNFLLHALHARHYSSSKICIQSLSRFLYSQMRTKPRLKRIVCLLQTKYPAIARSMCHEPGQWAVGSGFFFLVLQLFTWSPSLELEKVSSVLDRLFLFDSNDCTPLWGYILIFLKQSKNFSWIKRMKFRYSSCACHFARTNECNIFLFFMLFSRKN